MGVIRPGQCRHCNCTELDACKLPDGDPCSWFDSTLTVCSNPQCINAEMRRRADAHAEFERRKPKKLTPADVHKLIRSRGRRKPVARKGRVA